MRALIVDDERLARNELRRLLAAFPEIIVEGEARHADEADELTRRLRPDLLFLDIQMPGTNVFDWLAGLDDVPAVIFTTAYDDFAIRAFEVNALDYLLKPIDPARLGAAVAKAHAARTPRPEATAPLEQVFVRDGERCWFVKVADIRLLESEGNYTRLYFDDERPLILRSLNQIEPRLDSDRFFRASRRHIVNTTWITGVAPSVGGGLLLTLKGGLEVEVSRRQSLAFRERHSL
jgi:two-component system LytT family response regulator